MNFTSALKTAVKGLLPQMKYTKRVSTGIASLLLVAGLIIFCSSFNDEQSILNKYFAKLHAVVSYNNVRAASSSLEKPLTVENQQAILQSLSQVALVNDNEFAEILKMLKRHEKNPQKKERIGLTLLQLRYNAYGSALNIEETFISMADINGPGFRFTFEQTANRINAAPPPKRPKTFFVKYNLIKDRQS